MERASDYVLSVEDPPSPGDQRLIEAGLTQHALPITGPPGFRPIAVLARDRRRALVAGAVGTLNWNWLHVALLAADHGCTHAHLDTFSYQARPFYERRGYRVFGILDNDPPGHQRFFMQKSLGESAAPASDSRGVR